jgi:aminopeptidase N
MWVYLFCGPDRYKNEKTSKEMWQLIKERDILLKEGKDASAVRKKLFQLNEGRTFGFKYSFRVYREIAMQNSDFGGMENLGNTTITANRIMPYKEMPDGGFEYMIAVKVHEFYHNLNGSQVTGWSPFELWLNEAVTVHIERQFEAFVLGKNYQRLKEVLGLLSPDRGTFQLDEGAMSMPILPDGFNDPNELITSITYVKAAEFVKMIETFIGKMLLKKGLIFISQNTKTTMERQCNGSNAWKKHRLLT